VVLPLGLLLAGTAVFRFTDADLAISRWFYGGPGQGWPDKSDPPWGTLYHAGCYPGLILGFGGLTLAIASFCWSRVRGWRDPGLFLATLLVVGPGLLVNVTLKDNWGRPRPLQTVHFGGDHPFHRVGDPGPNSQCKSFPSGHASMGFYLMAPAFLLYRKRPRLAGTFLVLGLVCGCVIGVARIAQGRHFASDVLWAAGIVYFTGLILAYFHHRRPAKPAAGRESAPDLLEIDSGEANERHGKSESMASLRDYPQAA
jgi:membrane-associated PAP2 superfamily phosphatase